MAQRVRRDIWTLTGDLGKFARTKWRSALCRGELHHGGVLVHGVHILRKSRRNDRAISIGHIFRNSATGCSCFRQCADLGSGLGDAAFPMV